MSRIIHSESESIDVVAKESSLRMRAKRIARSLGTAMAITALGLAVIFSPAKSDSASEVGREIAIEEAIATPAKLGGFSRLRFRIVNDSTAVFHVLRIDTPFAEGARLVARVGTVEKTVLDSIGVSVGETLDLTTSHLWYEVGPLTQELRAGETFNMTLTFSGGSLKFPVHVHNAHSNHDQ